MKIGVLSDTHLESLTKEFTDLLEGPLGEADILIHAGDHVSGFVWEYLEFVDERPYYGVSGNMDSGIVTKELPVSRIVEAGGLRIGVVHGWGPPHGLAERVTEAFNPLPDIIIFGHSHMPLVKWHGNTLFVNPGSAFDKRFAPTRTVAIIDTSGDTPTAKILELGR